MSTVTAGRQSTAALRRTATRRKRLTWRKADRALLAIVELIECADATRDERHDLNVAADVVRAVRDRLPRP